MNADVLAWVTGVILIGAFAMAGAIKLMGTSMAVEMAKKLNYESLRMPIGGAEVLGAIGLLVGLIDKNGSLEWAGFLAAIGLILMMVGAVVYHVRGGDTPKEMAPSIVLGVLAVLYILGIANR